MAHQTRRKTASISTPNSANHPAIPRKKRPPEENIMRTMFKPASATYSFQRPPLATDKPIALYGRQSTLGQIELNTTSYDYQIEKQKEHIVEMGWSADLIVEYFQDFAVSATFGFGIRVGLTQLLTDIENDKVKTIYVFLEDRLFRDENQVNVSRFIDACQRHHVVVITSRYIYYMVDERDRDLFRIECERAWKAFKSQLYDRMMPMRVFSSHRGYYDARCIVPGYYVEKEKHSPMFKKYVIYEPHAEKVRYLYHRFVELGGSIAALLHELEADPGPHFFGCPSDHFHKKSNLIKVTGGYRIGSRVTLQGILSNKTYLGIWCTGDREYPNNHAAIIDQDTWNTVQFLLRKAQESRPAHTTANKEFPSLIRGLLRHPRAEEEKRYRIWVRSIDKSIVLEERDRNDIISSHTFIYSALVVEDAFLAAFRRHLLATDEVAHYQNMAAEVFQREKDRHTHIEAEIASLQALHDELYNDLYGPHRNRVAEHLKEHMHTQMGQLHQKIQELEGLLAHMPELLPYPELSALLDKVRHSHTLAVSEKMLALVTLFTKGIDLEPLSPHFFRVSFEWVLWQKDEAIIWRAKAPHTAILYTEQERDAFLRLYEQNAPKEAYMALFPSRSPSSIGTMVRRARGGGVYPFKLSHDVSDSLSLLDQQLVQQYVIPIEELRRREPVVFWQPTAQQSLEEASTLNAASVSIDSSS